MDIRRIQYARVPKIRMLNHRFRADAKHLIVTLDVEGYDPSSGNGFLTIYHALALLFPTLSRHSCCEEWENTPLFLHEEAGVSIKSVGEVADIAHLVEHVIVDLQCAISGMRLCSGITCGHRSPENRFDLFVECADPRVGAFSAHFAAFLVSSLFKKTRLSSRYRDLPAAAQLLLEDPALAREPRQLAIRMNRCLTIAHWALLELALFGLAEQEGDMRHEYGR